MEKPMKIAMMVRAFIPMPRPRDMIYAPIDLAIDVAKGLGERGHQVTLFSPLGTEVHGHNITVETMNLRPLVKNQAEFASLLQNGELLAHDVHGLWDRYMANEMFRRAKAGEFDILHFHHPESALSLAAEHQEVPVVYTLNDPIYSWYKELFELFKAPNQHYVAISDNQRRDAPDLNYLATVYNGIDPEQFTFSEEFEDYLLFIGRITPEKGVKEAIQVAKESDHRLLIIGPVDHANQDYFNQYIRPALNEKILYLGRMDRDQLPTYYQKAKALLTPVQWEEPFGLTTIEALACGTPVISLRRGAVSEIIEEGKNGFIANSIAEMVEAVGRLETIKRADCRKLVQDKFGVKQMVDGYEQAYRKVLGQTTIEQPLRPTAARIIRKMRKVRDILPNLSEL